jgi:hypothetical protein
MIIVTVLQRQRMFIRVFLKKFMLAKFRTTNRAFSLSGNLRALLKVKSTIPAIENLTIFSEISVF